MSLESYSSFGGADIIVSVGTQEFGTIQSISWSTSRAKAPIHVMNGSADPIAYGRGIRAIAGQLSFVNLDRDSFLSYMESANKDQFWQSKHESRATNNDEDLGLPGSETTSDAAWSTWNAAASVVNPSNGEIGNYRTKVSAEYADQVLPFDVHISYTNEYGKAARKSLFGVEIINEGSGISIQDLQLDTQYNFVARKMSRMALVNTAST